MNLIETTISLLAPHTCIVCHCEGSPLCKNCVKSRLSALSPVCYRCGKQLTSSFTCLACVKLSVLSRVWLGAPYDGIVKEAIVLLKFSRTKAMADSLAEWLNSYLPELPGDTLVSHAPTAYPRIRMRGYDQAKLIAKSFAKKRRLRYADTLRRTKVTRQVGSSRIERFEQLHNAFAVHKPRQLTGKTILLVDDVLTTGATLESAAKILRASGVKTVNAAVVAHALGLK